MKNFKMGVAMGARWSRLSWLGGVLGFLNYVKFRRQNGAFGRALRLQHSGVLIYEIELFFSCVI